MQPDDTLPLMTWRARPDMSCEHVNREWREYTGYTMEQAMGQGWSRCLHPEDLARWLDTCVAAFDRREPFEIEYRLRRRDGEYRWILERAAPRCSAGDLFVGFGAVCVDIDKRKREQQSVAQALERERRLRIATEEASRLRHGLMVSVLQELYLPSRAIATWAAHLRTQMPRGAALEAIERNARTQSRIIATLLELAQVPGVPPRERPLLSGVRVLVVGHNELVKPLEVAGADVRAAANADEALATVNSWRPDVLLAESNESFIRTLRSLPAERGGCLRAAALTTEGGAAAAASGYDAQLAKPVEPVALLATVAQLAA
jgi:PAS domain S-box-containing protein